MALEDIEFPQHYISGGVYVKQLILEHKDDTVLGHAHALDHLSLLAKGVVDVDVEGVSTRYVAPTAVTVKAGLRHQIRAVTDDCLWYCIHAIPDDLRGEELLDDVVIRRVPQVMAG